VIDKNLTVKSGLDEVWEVINEFEVILNEYSDIVYLLKKCREKISKKYLKNITYIKKRKEWWCVSTDECSKLAKLERGYSYKIKKIALLLTSKINNLIETTIKNNYSHVEKEFCDVFLEALINAIEYWSNYCKEWNIKINFIQWNDKIISTISQNKTGLSSNQIEQLKPNIQYTYFKENVPRGSWLSFFCKVNTAQVWFESNPTSSTEKFKVIILWTMNRYKEAEILG